LTGKQVTLMRLPWEETLSDPVRGAIYHTTPMVAIGGSLPGAYAGKRELKKFTSFPF